jgi:hypothetical protein
LLDHYTQPTPRSPRRALFARDGLMII